MVNGPFTEAHDKSHEPAPSVFVALNGIVRCRHAVKCQIIYPEGLTVIQAQWKINGTFHTVANKFPVGFGDYKVDFPVYAQQGYEGVGIEVIGVVVTGGYDVNNIQQFRLNDQFTNPHVRFDGALVLFCKGIREVGIEQNAYPFPLNEKTTLTKPPDIELILT